MKIDPFYLIVPSATWIERLVPLGVKLVQLRVKEGTEPSLRGEIRAARAVCERHDCQLIVNDHCRLAIDEGCDFIHLGQEDLADADVAAIRRTALKLGLSTHDHDELGLGHPLRDALERLCEGSQRLPLSHDLEQPLEAADQQHDLLATRTRGAPRGSQPA